MNQHFTYYDWTRFFFYLSRIVMALMMPWSDCYIWRVVIYTNIPTFRVLTVCCIDIIHLHKEREMQSDSDLLPIRVFQISINIFIAERDKYIYKIKKNTFLHNGSVIWRNKYNKTSMLSFDMESNNIWIISN